MRPGSLPWLLRHELRVRWREALGDTKPATALLVLALGCAAVVLLFYPLVVPLRGMVSSPLPPEAVFLGAAVLLVLTPFGLTIGINHSVVALFERGDLDLLASSPLRARTLFASRLLAVAAGVFLTLGAFVLPLLALALVAGVPRLLGAVPLLAAVALVTASLGMLVTLALVRLLGPRRARTVSQVLAALSGALLFLLAQLPNLLSGGPGSASDRVGRLLSYFEPGGPLAADSPLWLPARTLYLDPAATAFTLAASAAVAWAAVAALQGAYARGIGLSEGSRRRLRARASAEPRFASGGGPVRALLVKEWKLIARDPYLVSQTLLQLIYLLPAAYVLLRGDEGLFTGLRTGPALGVTITALVGTLSASLARICVAGEEAPDLLAAAPLPGSTVRRAKLLAATLPALALCLPLAVGLAATDLLSGAAAIVCGAAAALGTATVRLWNPVRVSRGDLFRRRRAQGDLALFLVEGFTPLAWAAACYLAATLSPWTAAALAASVALPLLGLARARGRRFAFEG